jgi:hypothetical protein
MKRLLVSIILFLAAAALAACLNFDLPKPCNSDAQCNPGRYCDPVLWQCLDGEPDGARMDAGLPDGG